MEVKVTEKKLVCTGIRCPMPIVKISQAIKRMAQGESLEVLADDPAFAENLKAWCRLTGNLLVSINQVEGEFKAIIKKK